MPATTADCWTERPDQRGLRHSWDRMLSMLTALGWTERPDQRGLRHGEVSKVTGFGFRWTERPDQRGLRPLVEEEGYAAH